MTTHSLAVWLSAPPLGSENAPAVKVLAPGVNDAAFAGAVGVGSAGAVDTVNVRDALQLALARSEVSTPRARQYHVLPGASEFVTIDPFVPELSWVVDSVVTPVAKV